MIPCHAFFRENFTLHLESGKKGRKGEGPLSLETPMDVSLENPRFSSDLQRKIGVSNENMGVSNRFSPTKIWGLQRESGGLQRDVHRGLK